jgi:ParB family chromosome partitioning protein
VQALMDGGSLSAGHARALLGSQEPERLARLVSERQLNVRETEELVRREAARPRQARPRGRAEDPHVRELEERLTSSLGLEVGIRAKGKGGMLTIHYHDLDQLDGLIRRLQ